ncbi:hypothetical protein DBR17_17900 [Sphingomonas sp. HMWF008]|nr:hypothetical protein DBR17_17900 [Sphingomonas sp. HMWF008]
MKPAGGKVWFTAAELAELALPGMPRTKRNMTERAASECWAVRTDANGAPLARKRAARGGGTEYHHAILPAAARAALAAKGIIFEGTEEASAPVSTAVAQRWQWFDAQPEHVKAKAQRRVGILASVDAYLRAGMTKTAAVTAVSARASVSPATLYNWLGMVDRIDPAHRLPYVAPQRKGGGTEVEVDAAAWQFIRSDYLRPEKPTWAQCYRNLEDVAARHGWSVPHARTLWRKFEREVPIQLVIALREGQEALRRTLPPQNRTVADLHALEAVNIDGHKFDVFVRFPPSREHPQGKIGRVVMIAIQDLYSRKFLAWRIGESESAILTRLCFADLFRDWGIPQHCVLDNGRAFASKWITGGAKTRFRFTVKEDEPLGLLTQLNVQTHWTFPFRGQSKPIERGFRDLASDICKHADMAGAYTGNRTDAKPENYGNAAIPLDQFERHVAREIVKHNARLGRRTEMAYGKLSFDQVFAASYAVSQIGKAATAEQLRLALLMAEEISADRKSGAISLAGNRYWHADLHAVRGKKVTIRFDPEDLTADIHVYDRQGRYVASAPILEADGFFDLAASKRSAKQYADLRRRVREMEQLQDLLAVGDVAALLNAAEPDQSPAPIASVIRPIRARRGGAAAALKIEPDAMRAATASNDPLTAVFERLTLVK